MWTRAKYKVLNFQDSVINFQSCRFDPNTEVKSDPRSITKLEPDNILWSTLSEPTVFLFATELDPKSNIILPNYQRALWCNLRSALFGPIVTTPVSASDTESDHSLDRTCLMVGSRQRDQLRLTALVLQLSAIKIFSYSQSCSTRSVGYKVIKC